jgi:hypothetical protein
MDVLAVVNFLNAHGSRALPRPTALFKPPPYVDVNGDNVVSPVDALIAINYINHAGSSGAGEAEGKFVTPAAQVRPKSQIRRESPAPRVRRESPPPPQSPTAGLSGQSARNPLPVGRPSEADRDGLGRPPYDIAGKSSIAALPDAFFTDDLEAVLQVLAEDAARTGGP